MFWSYALRELHHAVFTAVVNTYWPIINKCHVHHGLEDAVLDLFTVVKLLHMAEELGVKLAGVVGTR